MPLSRITLKRQFVQGLLINVSGKNFCFYP
jgi:hypothetical protein